MKRQDSNDKSGPIMPFAEDKHVIVGQQYKHAHARVRERDTCSLKSNLNYTRHVFIKRKMLHYNIT